MALRDEIDRIVTFEATESRLVQNAFQGPQHFSEADTRELFIAVFTMFRGVSEALFRLADEIDAMRDSTA